MDKTTQTLSGYVTSLRYADLSPHTVQEAKRHLIDSLGCARGGYSSEPAAIARRVAPTASGAPSARLLGESRSTTPEAAAFANSVMIRFLDANDTYIARGSGHPSDMLGALLAAAESADASGRDLLLAMVAGYEVFAALADQVSLRERGWGQAGFRSAAATDRSPSSARTSSSSPPSTTRRRRSRWPWPSERRCVGRRSRPSMCRRTG